MPLFNQSGYGSGRYGLADVGPIAPLPLSYYLGLLTSEYRLAPNLNAWLQAELQVMDDASGCIAQITNSFDLENAAGVQLDTAGAIIGQGRTVGFQPTGGVSPVLDDTTYRLLLIATIVNNQWNGLPSQLYPLWAQLFPGGRIAIIDNQNMSATILSSGSFTSIVKDLIANGYIVPRPEGVQYTYVFSDLPVFGFSTSNGPYIAGFDVGKWS
jgi:hypothetical protein